MTTQTAESPVSLWPAAHDEDADRPRSWQVQLGASDTVCERRAAYVLAGTERTDESDKTAAILGTYAHEGLLSAAKRRYGWLVETKVGDDLVRGSIDAVQLDEATARRLPKRLRPVKPAQMVTVEDIKTKSTHVWDRTVRYGATAAELRQVYLYAYLLSTVGWEDRWGQKPLARLGPVQVRRIRFRFINRDNGAEHIQEFDYDPDEAARARWWVERVTELSSPEEATRTFDGPGLDAICGHCHFRTACWGLGASPGAPVQTVLIHDDADRAQALADYVTGHELETKGKAMKKKVRAMLDASTPGVYGANELKWTGGNEKREETPDREAMLDRFHVLGVEPPERAGPDWEAMERLMVEAGLAVPMRTVVRTTPRAIKVAPVARS
ncbi:PD-(D/E)XK nuclease family protein [Streptomyces uncialis]|uniref:PD-(D/E)XK nuclease family protein n=1 Tax=Streptomyces uncialis TaxID=1048205 RepID=UPI003802DAF5